MHFDLTALPARDRYKLLVGVVVPRPIALVTSMDDDGAVNAAPFSFFNVMGSDPPLIALGIGNRSRGEPKDTARNIRSRREFCVSIVDETIAEAMNVCAVDFPPEVNELQAANLTVAAPVQVETPYIAEAPVSMECREACTLEIGRNRIILGEVVHLHIRDGLVDADSLLVHAEKIQAVGRLHGAGWYSRTTDQFQMPRLTYQDWLEMQPEASADKAT